MSTKEKSPFEFSPETLKTDEKVDKRFEETFSNLLAIVGGDRKKTKLKKQVPNDMLGKILDDFFQEEEKVLIEDFKKEFKALLVDWAGFQKTTKVAYDAMRNEVKKQKEIFIERGQKVISMVQGIAELKKGLSTAVKQAAGQPEEVEEDTDNANTRAGNQQP